MPLDPFTHLHAMIGAGFVLTLAAAMDLSCRSVPNGLWIAATVPTVPVRILLDIEAGHSWSTVVWVLGLTAFAMALWFTGTWGGADAKGTIWLASAVPAYDLGTGIPVHPLALAIPATLAVVLLWPPAPRGFPVFAAYGPLVLAVWIFFWQI